MRWVVDGAGLTYPVDRHATLLLKEAIKTGAYKVPQKLLDEFRGESKLAPKIEESESILFSIDTMVLNDSSLYIDGWVFSKDNPEAIHNWFVILSGANGSFISSTAPMRRPDVVRSFEMPVRLDCGFGVLLGSPIPKNLGKIGVGAWIDGKFKAAFVDVS